MYQVTSQDTSFGVSIMLRGLIILILTALFTIFCVRESKIIGRLSTSPNYDDCTYCLSGAVLLSDVKTDGIHGCAAYLKKPAPCGGLHSPYSVLLAATSYTVFGLNEAAPYYGNALVVFIYLCFMGWLLRGLPTLSWFFILVVFLSPPFITMGVVEFRPDIAWATVVGFGVVYIVTCDRIFRNPIHGLIAGLLLGLALDIKPSTFVMTLLLFGGGMTSRVVGAILDKQLKPDFKVLYGIFASLAGVVLVAGPYWIYYGKEIIAYFWDNSFGSNKSIWIYQGNMHDFSCYYLTGEGWRSNMQYSGLLILIVAVICLIYLGIKKPDLRWKLISLIILILGAFAVNTAAQMKSPFLGGGIYGTFLFSASYVMASAWMTFQKNGESTRRHVSRNALLLILTVLAFVIYRWPVESNWERIRGFAENFHAANDFMKETFNCHSGDAPKSILFIPTSPIIMETTGIYLEKINARASLFSGAFYNSTNQFCIEYPNADWVVIQEQGVMGSGQSMPSEQLLPQFLRILKADPNYSQIAEFVSGNGKKVWIYSKVKK
jgi:hypothetical protein